LCVYSYCHTCLLSRQTHPSLLFLSFFFNDAATFVIYTLSLHDALPILCAPFKNTMARSKSSLGVAGAWGSSSGAAWGERCRTKKIGKHTSELQSLTNLVCRLLLEKKKKHKMRENVLTKTEA